MTARAAVALLVVGWSAASQPTPGGTARALRVFSSNGVKAWLEDVRPQIEQRTARPVTFEFSTAADLHRRIEGGDVPDVAVLTMAIVDALSSRRILAADSRRLVARVGVGVGVRADAPDAHVGTLEALRSFLLDAHTLTFTAEGQSRAAIDAAFERLDIVDAMRAKTQLRGPGEAPGAVASGASEVVLTLLSEMTGVAGLKVLGPFPPGVQRYVTFAAARRASGGDLRAAERLLQALGSAEVATRLAVHGLEPLPPG